MREANGKAEKTSSTFSQQCGVAIRIQATPARVWAILTAAADFPRWNSTVTSLEGRIALGEKLAVRVPAAPKRTFKVTILAFEPERRMLWGDGAAPMFRGRRTYTLTPQSGGSVDFEMVEVFSGLMLPMIRGSLPDFGPVFERYAADLKREAERGG